MKFTTMMLMMIAILKDKIFKIRNSITALAAERITIRLKIKLVVVWIMLLIMFKAIRSSC